MKKIIPFLFILSFVINHSSLQSQDTQPLTPDELEDYKKQVSNLVKYVEGTLNFLGDPEQVNVEKQIIIEESYLKIFEDDKVQIEDDLDENREVPIHKDVQAYLKDVIFFFRQVHFEFEIADISHFANEDNLHYFRVSFNRMLEGITVTGDSVQSRKARFMEVNLDMSSNDLKIASIYTTKLNEKEETRQWWIGLSPDWKKIFGTEVMITDSIELADVSYFTDSLLITYVESTEHIIDADTTLNYDIEMPEERQTPSNTISAYDTVFLDTKDVYSKLSIILKQSKLDISNNENIRNISPLNELSDLVELNCSNTLISSLFPIRNLNRLEILDFSNTPVDDISALNYSTTLKELNCSYTLLDDLSPIAGLVNIEKLECSGIKMTDLGFTKNMQKLKALECGDSRIIDLSPLKHPGLLESLDISGTKITSLDSLVLLNNLKYLNCENSSILSIDPLTELLTLEVLRISNTEINSLDALNDAENLKKIYCDNSGISKEIAIKFMKDNPGCLVIFESEELLAGWQELEDEWKNILMGLGNFGEDPTREELHSLMRIEELDLSGNTEITYVLPVRRLFSLKSLNLSSVKIEDYSPVGMAIEIEWLDMSSTQVENVNFLNSLSRLKELHIENTTVSALEPLQDLTNLKFIYADSSGINDAAAFKFRENNPECLVIYKTEELEDWWKSLPDSWTDYFTDTYSIESTPTKENLHELLFIDSLVISERRDIIDLNPITKLKGMKSLTLSGTQISNLQPVNQLNKLESIKCNQSPVSVLLPLSGLGSLTYVDIENTPVSDLGPLAGLSQLKELNFSGTQVSNMKPISDLVSLEVVKLNNTQLKNLKQLQSLPKLKTVECYNTRISPKTVDKFRAVRPYCEVIYY